MGVPKDGVHNQQRWFYMGQSGKSPSTSPGDIRYVPIPVDTAWREPLFLKLAPSTEIRQPTATDVTVEKRRGCGAAVDSGELTRTGATRPADDGDGRGGGPKRGGGDANGAPFDLFVKDASCTP